MQRPGAIICLYVASCGFKKESIGEKIGKIAGTKTEWVKSHRLV